MRFNGKDLRDVHGRLSINKEIPPGTARREIEYVRGRVGATVAGVRYEPDEYKARINIACTSRSEAWDVRALLAGWAASSGESVAALEPTNWPGKAYDAILSSIGAPEFVHGFATVDVVFAVPYPFARDTAVSRAGGAKEMTMRVGGTHACRPAISQTITGGRIGLTWTIDGKPLLRIKDWRALEDGQIVVMDVKNESLTIDGVHAEDAIDWSGTDWDAAFTPGAHVIKSVNGGTLEAEWHNEWT